MRGKKMKIEEIFKLGLNKIKLELTEGTYNNT